MGSDWIMNPILQLVERSSGIIDPPLGSMDNWTCLIRSAQITQNHNHAMLDISGALLHHFPLKGHLRSHYDVIGSRYVFLPITFDRNELETWGWRHSVRLVKVHRLICNMTYLGYTVTLIWRDLRSNFKIGLSRITKKTYGWIRLDERNTMVSKLFL